MSESEKIEIQEAPDGEIYAHHSAGPRGPFQTVRLSCDGCALAAINGRICHESGCHLSWIDPVTGEGYPLDCFECGGSFVPESRPATANPNARGVRNICPDCLNPEPLED